MRRERVWILTGRERTEEKWAKNESLIKKNGTEQKKIKKKGWWRLIAEELNRGLVFRQIFRDCRPSHRFQ